jgi:hypothetical protein
MSVDTTPLMLQIEETESELASPLPTPPVGTLVVWYDRGVKAADAQRAAIVTKVEGPGKVQLTVFAPNAMPMHKIGSLHISHSVHEKAHNSVSKNSGGWDYRDGEMIPGEHYDLHRNVLNTKLESMRKSLDEAKQIAAKEGAEAKASRKRGGDTKSETTEPQA